MMTQKVCLAICTPMRSQNETITAQWHRGRMQMSMPSNINTFELFADGLEIGDARSKVAAMVLAHKPQPPEMLFFLDNDVIMPLDGLTKLFCRARCYPEYDIYAGVYTLKRGNTPEPLIYGEPGQGAIWNWALGDLLTTERHGVKATHMGLTLIRTSLFQRMLDAKVVNDTGDNQDDEPFFKTINEERQLKDGKVILQMGTEDIYFYDKASKVDCKIMVDTSVLAGHIDKNTGIVYGLPFNYGPTKKAEWLNNKDQVPGQKLALDLGAGNDRRHWPDHITYTTDMRPDTKPDYVMDSRKINLPNDHFDLVASSHHLEHLGRWDQEDVWKEMFRITKPGGKCEHIVPSIEWAAYKIKENDIDSHVYNVLYGAQEAHDYARNLNTHYFGYTKEIAKHLAELAGYINVVTQDWRDRETLNYNMIITAEKPNG